MLILGLQSCTICNVFAICFKNHIFQGASTAIGLVLNIAASLIAFKSFVAFLDALIGWFGDFAGAQSLSFQAGFLFFVFFSKSI